MSNITIKIEFMCGTSFCDAANEAMQLARRMGVAYVKYDFNGVSVSVGQNADVKQMKHDYADGKKHIVSA